MHIWRERLNRWFAPLGRSCPVSPNTISVIALLVGVAGAVLLSLGSARPSLFLWAAGLICASGLLDAFDGVVARVQNKATKFGDFLDHVLDRLCDLAVVAGWIAGTAVRPAIALPALIAVALHGYAGTQLEATFRTRNYEGLGRGEFVLGMISFPLIAFSLASAGILLTRYALLSIPEWLTLVIALGASAGVAERIQRARRIPPEIDV